MQNSTGAPGAYNGNQDALARSTERSTDEQDDLGQLYPRHQSHAQLRKPGHAHQHGEAHAKLWRRRTLWRGRHWLDHHQCRFDRRRDDRRGHPLGCEQQLCRGLGHHQSDRRHHRGSIRHPCLRRRRQQRNQSGRRQHHGDPVNPKLQLSRLYVRNRHGYQLRHNHRPDFQLQLEGCAFGERRCRYQQ